MQSINLYSSKVKPRRVFPTNDWIEGISDYNKIGGSYIWGRGVDYRTEPSQLTILPAGISESGPPFTDLVKWAEQVVGRTVILGNSTNLIANGSFETNTTGWTLGADFTRASDDAQIGSFSIKQVSTSGTLAVTTASGSGLVVTAYADYQLTFWAKVAQTSGNPPQLSILGGSLSGPNLLTSPLVLPDTAGVWKQFTVTLNASQYTSVFLSIANNGGNLTAHYDNFSLVQINSLAVYGYGNAGNLYKRYSNATWVSLGTVPNSHGNGQAYYGEDDFLYIMGDKTVGRYGPISSGTPTLVADYLTSAGGVPTNTNSPLLIAANSDYFVKTTPAAALKITGDLAIEAFVKPTSLPAVGSSMTIAGLWKDSGNLRGYKLDILGISGIFGDAADGNVTISGNTIDAPTDSAASGTSGSNQLNANNVSFAAGQKILIIQMQGSGAGTYQRTTIQGYDSTNHIITTQDALNFSYNSTGSNKAQVLVMKRYGNVTVNNGIIWQPKQWNGTTGGILAFYANGTFTNNGTVSGDSFGFRGVTSDGGAGKQGEGSAGPGGTRSLLANGNGGGGGTQGVSGSAVEGAHGGGGGNLTVGQSVGRNTNSATAGAGGNATDASDLSTLTLGGAGGSAGADNNGNNGGQSSANGGGALFAIVASISNPGLISMQGGSTSSQGNYAVPGAGAGGSVLVYTQSGSVGTVNLSGGTGGSTLGAFGGHGGNGGSGALAVRYLTSISVGTVTPNTSYVTIQDNTLVTTTTYQVRLGISNDGTSFEFLTQNLVNLGVGVWDRIAVSWQAALSTATFYENAVSIGTSTGTKTAINASTADFAVGANFGASAYQNFFDGEVNDVRVWNTQRSAGQLSANNLVNLNGIAAGLVGNWFLTNTGNDLTTNADNLVATGTPTPGYVTDVPYPGATTRGDIDQTGGGTGQTYTLPIVLTENQKQNFVPAQDPQKSLQLNINAKGTGDWTVVVHDGLNRQVATVTVTNANLPTSGQYEFVYTAVFTPVVGATYHYHIYSTVADGTIKTSATTDLTTAQFTTYFQFLVNDTEYHPAMQMGNVLGIGNGRYLAVINAAGGDGIGIYNGQGFNGRRLRFPAGWRVRCLAQWQGYYAIGCWKGTNIKDFDQGIVFLWDGVSITYNDYFFVPEGGINAMWGENDILYISAGYKGDILEYTGASKHNLKVKRIPRVGKANYMEVAPGAMTFYGALLRVGVAYNSDSPTLEKGIYTWGTLNEKYPKSLSYDYPISTGNRLNTVQIGALVPVGGSLLQFYQDNVSFGVNNINPANPCQTSATLEGLISDYAIVWKDKDLLTIRVDQLPLKLGENIDLKYKLNYETNWHNKGIGSQIIGDQQSRYQLPNPQTQYHSMQMAIDLTATNGTAPTVLEQSQLSDLLIGEMDENPFY